MVSQARGWKAAIAGAAALLLLVLAVALYARSNAALVADSDFAVLELHTELASRGRLLTGPYSRYSWSHPGPVYAYLQAPLYVAGGRHAASLFAGALLINIAAVILLAWCAWRSGGPGTAVLLTAACVVLAWRTPRLLASPWTGHVAVLASMAFTVLCAAAISGRTRLLPIALVAGSFAVQTHLSNVPMVIALSALAIAMVVRAAWSKGEPQGRVLGAAAAAALLLWSLPIADALFNNGGNLRALWEFFVTESGGGIPLRDAFDAWAFGLTTILRPGAALPWGGHLSIAAQSWIAAAAIAQVAGLLVAALVDRRARRFFESALAVCAFTASAIGLWATTRIAGPPRDHEIFWLAGLGALNLAIVAGVALRQLPLRVSLRAMRASQAAALILLAALGIAHLRDLASYEMRRTTPRRIPLAHQAIRDYLRVHDVRKPLLEMQAASWSEGAGILLRLYQDGIPIAVTDASVPIVTRRFAATGAEDALITISPRYGYHYEQQGRPGNITLLEADPVFVNAIRLTPGR